MYFVSTCLGNVLSLDPSHRPRMKDVASELTSILETFGWSEEQEEAQRHTQMSECRRNYLTSSLLEEGEGGVCGGPSGLKMCADSSQQCAGESSTVAGQPDATEELTTQLLVTEFVEFLIEIMTTRRDTE